MDFKVYEKETVLQPSGATSVYIPNVTDLYPVTETIDGVEYLTGADIREDSEELEQRCTLATIWQKGNDPLNLDYGVRWSEMLLNEINIIQLMEDLSSIVADITSEVKVTFDTVTDASGNELFTYILQGVI